MNARPIDRLAKYLDFIGILPSIFEKKAGISNGYILNNKVRKGGIGSEILDKIHKTYPELNILWLISGEGEMVVKKIGNTPTIPSSNTPFNKKNKAIPLSEKGNYAS